MKSVLKQKSFTLKKLFSANPWICLLANVILIANNKTEQISNVWGGLFL